jgi:hypothetical protein
MTRLLIILSAVSALAVSAAPASEAAKAKLWKPKPTLVESGGRTAAHNAQSEDSRGLWRL